MTDERNTQTANVAEVQQTNGQNTTTVSASADQKPMAAETKKAKIDAINFVKVKKYAADTAPVVGYVRKGETVTVLGSEKGYKRIKFGDEVGYIPYRFCKED